MGHGLPSIPGWRNERADRDHIGGLAGQHSGHAAVRAVWYTLSDRLQSIERLGRDKRTTELLTSMIYWYYE